MSDKAGKKKTKKSAKAAAEPGVLGSLPGTRPDRLGRERAAPKAPTARAPAKTAAAAKPEPKVTAAKARAKKAAPATAKSRPRTPAGTTPPRPAAATPPPPPADGRRRTPPSGPELVTTAVQAAGELAQIGVSVGVRVIKRAASRLPRP